MIQTGIPKLISMGFEEGLNYLFVRLLLILNVPYGWRVVGIACNQNGWVAVWLPMMDAFQISVTCPPPAVEAALERIQAFADA